jgi:hypothetical protein
VQRVIGIKNKCKNNQAHLSLKQKKQQPGKMELQIKFAILITIDGKQVY